MNILGKNISRLSLVLITLLSAHEAFAVAPSTGGGGNTPTDNNGMNFNNHSSDWLHVSYIEQLPLGQTACPAKPILNSGDSISMVYAPPINPPTGNATCNIVTTIAAGSSEPQAVALPGLSITGQMEFQIFTSQTQNGNETATCFNNEYGKNDDGTYYPLPILNGQQPFSANPKDSAVKMPTSFLTSNGYSTTYTPISNNPTVMGCVFNVNLSQWSYNVAPITQPSIQMAVGSNYDGKSDFLELSQAFANNYATQIHITPALSPSNLTYYITAQQPGSAGTPVVIPGISGTTSMPTSSPLGLFYYNSASNNMNSLFMYNSNLQPTNNVCNADGVCQINICSCDTGIGTSAAAGTLPVDLSSVKAGICPDSTNASTGGMTSCEPPANTDCSDGATWLNTDGSVKTAGTCFDISIIKGVIAKQLSEIVPSSQPIAPGKQPISGPTVGTMIGLPATGGTVDLSAYFKIVGYNDTTAPTVTYSIVGPTDAIPDRNNGDTPVPNPAAPPTNVTMGEGWEPVVIHNGSIATPVPTSTTFSITGSQLTIANTTDNQIIQFTVKATDPDGSTAYQTLYANLSSLNTALTGTTGYIPKYTLLSNAVSAWMYGSTALQDPTNITPAGTGTSLGIGCYNGKVTPIADCNSNSPDYPNCAFAKTLQSGNINIVTPDIGWVEYGSSQNYMTYWDDQLISGPLYNNMYLDDPKTGGNGTDFQGSLVDCTAKYFKKAAPNTKFVVTFEYDTPVRGDLPTMQSVMPKGSNGFSRMTKTVSNLAAGIVQDPSIDGVQFDIEPFPGDGSALIFFRNVSDLLARAGKIDEVFAFAESDTPATIAALGPLGIFLPSTYDVNSTTDPYYFGKHVYDSQFGLTTAIPLPASVKATSANCPGYPEAYFTGTPAECPLKQYDYACHFPASDGTNVYNFIVSSWCNNNVENTLLDNATRFGMALTNPDGTSTGGVNKNFDFAYDNQVYGGHFQLAVASEGSATNWTYDIVYNPSLVNASGTCDTSKTTNCTIPSVPSTYSPTYVPEQMTEGETSPTYNNAELQYSATNYTDPTTQQLAPLAYPPAAGQYYVFYDKNVGTPPSVKIPCSMNNLDPAGTNMCRALVVSANANPEANTSLATPDKATQVAFNGDYSPSGSTSYMTSQYSYIQSILQLAMAGTGGDFDSQGGRYTYSQGVRIGRPQQTGGVAGGNPNNLGLALYALANESAYNCLPGESHGGTANCQEEYPMGTDYPTTSTVEQQAYGGDIWTDLINAYMGGSTPPPPAAITLGGISYAQVDDDYYANVSWTLPAGIPTTDSLYLCVDSNTPTSGQCWQMGEAISSSAGWGSDYPPGNYAHPNNQIKMAMGSSHTGYIVLMDSTGKNVLASASAPLQYGSPIAIAISPGSVSCVATTNGDYYANVGWTISGTPTAGSTLELYVDNPADYWQMGGVISSSAGWGKDYPGSYAYPNNQIAITPSSGSHTGYVALLDSTGTTIASANQSFSCGT